MTVANDQHAKECEMEHQSEGVLMEELGRLLGEVKASARSAIHMSYALRVNLKDHDQRKGGKDGEDWVPQFALRMPATIMCLCADSCGSGRVSSICKAHFWPANWHLNTPCCFSHGM